MVLLRVHIPRKCSLFRWHRWRKPKNRPSKRRIRHPMTIPAIPPGGNEVVDNALLLSGVVSCPLETMDGIDEG